MFPQRFYLVRNRRRKCEIASKYTKTSRQILVGIAEQAVTPALVIYYEGVKKIFAVVYCYLFSVYAKLTLRILKFTDNIGLRIRKLQFTFFSSLFEASFNHGW